jgi:hypothetical protein
MTCSFHLASAQSAGWVPSSVRVGKLMSASSSQPPGARLLGWGRGVSGLVLLGEVEGIVRDGWEKADVLEGALHEFWPVGQGAGEHAAVDEVEGLGKVPVFF